MADPERCARAGIPDTLRFREKWRIAVSQIRRAREGGLRDHGGRGRRRLRLHRGLSASASSTRVAVRAWRSGAA